MGSARPPGEDRVEVVQVVGAAQLISPNAPTTQRDIGPHVDQTRGSPTLLRAKSSALARVKSSSEQMLALAPRKCWQCVDVSVL